MLYEFGPRARRVYQVLLDRIRSGELAPGARLPAHTQLAAGFGVAPLTMRQVLARLEADRLVVRERGRGTFVRAADVAQVLIVAAPSSRRAALEQQVRAAGKRSVVAATPADARAAIEREALPSLAIVDLQVPTAAAGLRLVRDLRERLPEMPLVVLSPTRRQRTRLEHTVSAPLLFVEDETRDELSQVLRTEATREESTASRTGTRQAQSLQSLLERYVALQLTGERGAARSLILQAGLSMAELYRSVLQPAQYRIGDLWQGNRISVAREHLATAVTEGVMLQVAASAPQLASTGMRILVACAEGELHDIGARMVADLLEVDGFTVQFLGADVPTDGLLAIIHEERPHLVILSAAMAERLASLALAVARLRQTYGSGLRIFVGGQVMDWTPQEVRALEVDLAARDALDTVAGARRLLTDAGFSRSVGLGFTEVRDTGSRSRVGKRMFDGG